MRRRSPASPRRDALALNRFYEDTIRPVPGSAADRRLAVQAAEKERAAARQQELDAQASPLNEPQERIRIWERLHALRLPQAPGHSLVRVFARQTRLTVSQVHEEQQRRAEALASRDASQGSA